MVRWAFERGRNDCRDKRDKKHNPFEEGTEEYRSWLNGWLLQDAKK